MIPGIHSKLLDIESEVVNAGEPDTLFDAVDHRAFSSYSERVLATYRLQFPGITAGWVSVAGFEPGILTPLAASSPDVLRRVPDLQKAAARTLAPNWVEDLTAPGVTRYLTAPSRSARQAMVIRLKGHDEYYGLMVLCSDSSHYFDATIVLQIRDTLPLLNRVMAEQNFSMRLSRLAAPFEFDKGLATKELMYQQIVRLACRGFAADGAVLRFRRPSADEPSGYALDVVAREGRVSDAQIAQEDAGHRICLAVLTSEVGITVQSFQNGARVGLGAIIGDTDDAGLRAFGVESYIIMKLQSDLAEDHPTGMGTLSVFHRMPEVFSRRDISLFRGFCERVADDIALLEQRDSTEAMSRFLQVQNALGTRSEIIALLGHDFGHRVMHVTEGVDSFVDSCKRNWKDRKLPDAIAANALELKKACDELAGVVHQIRVLGQGVDEPPSTFDVADLYAEIRRTLGPVLERNRMTLDYRVDGSATLVGVRAILLQALFNLAVNSIDAQRSAGRNKHNTLHMTCREFGSGASRRLDFNVWDEGPGISRVVFPDAQEIFTVGRSSKPKGQGTGTGLPAARNLLGRHFNTDLKLVDRNKALFQFSVPAPTAP